MTDVNLEGTGATIAFGSSTVTSNLVTLGMSEQTREALDTTHLGTTDAKTYKPSKLKDVGDISCTFDHDPAEGDLILEDTEEVVITYPVRTGESVGAKRTFNAFVISEGGESFEVGGLLRTNRTLKVSGDITKTAAVPEAS